MDNNFDWFVGEWTSTQHRLRAVLAGSDDWYEFPGVHRSWNVLDGVANFDEAMFPTQGFGGVTLRLYDRSAGEWSLYWASSRSGLLELPPVVGRFGDDGRGVFTGPDVYDGKPITVRYLWSDITANTARWEQAFSVDDGATWEVNWVAEFTRSS
ncbi:MAG TPA: hypothetical protein VHO00_10195 [Actinomycetes bacterium]|jgi:hypothetical protein|nr:hypothetical protein [Actinomycetes bacterium]